MFIRKKERTIGANIILIIVALTCLLPFLVIVSASFSSESKLMVDGYGLFPRGITLEAYKITFANGKQIINSYILTALTTFIGSALSVFLIALAAFPLSRKDFEWKKYFNLYFYFTMIFSGGAVSSYLWITQGLHLRDNPLVLILPSLISAWNIFLMRTYMSSVSSEMIEAAKIDGAGEYSIFFKIILPLNVVGIATIFVMTALSFWNQWYACLMYFTDDKYMTLQYYLMRVMNEIDSILNSPSSVSLVGDMATLPSETTRMAMCVIAAGPMVFVFSFFQKYFVGGVQLGSVKG